MLNLTGSDFGLSVKIPEATQRNISELLKNIEETSEIVRCIVVTRTGIKIAPDMDADAYSASSAALIDLGERVVASLEHGTLQELVINALGGYVILVAVGTDYMLLGATSAALKMGYYLPYMRQKSWELEGIIYGKEVVSLARKQEVSANAAQSEAARQSGTFSMDEMKAADIKAMNDVLSAFDDFGIDDNFAKSLGDEAVPSISISADEMEQITQQIHNEPPAPARGGSAVQKPVAARSSSIPSLYPPVAPKIATASTVATTGQYPIPIEPGEVPPIPLELTEWNPLGTEEGEPQPDEEATSAGVPTFTSVPHIESSPEMQAQQSPRNAPPPAGPPIFDEASEYDFEVEDLAKSKKVVIPEQDSMASALKALGWEEEDDGSK
jgi:predicted regulator of Ras-like GTPase activity (Roadblock/LC7/MglB family)